MNLLDKLNMGPERELKGNGDGTYTLKVTPASWSGLRDSSSIVLTGDQVDRYDVWRTTHILIQEAFPDLSPDQREIILTGISNRDYPKDSE